MSGNIFCRGRVSRRVRTSVSEDYAATRAGHLPMGVPHVLLTTPFRAAASKMSIAYIRQLTNSKKTNYLFYQTMHRIFVLARIIIITTFAFQLPHPPESGKSSHKLLKTKISRSGIRTGYFRDIFSA